MTRSGRTPETLLNNTVGKTDSAANFSAALLCALDRRLSAEMHDRRSPPSPRLLEAMRYSVLNGGKYIRPALVYASAEAVSGKNNNGEGLDDAACAVEFIHAYSLIHDDLPAMDDDEMRRGKPACHALFGEGIAILAGDALQVRAFEILAHCPAFVPEQKLRMIKTLSAAIGVDGMAGGQAMDLLASSLRPDRRRLEDIHRAKTGSLICAAVLLGAIARNADVAQHEALKKFAEPIGLAFQVRDDLLDFDENTDTAHSKEDAVSYPALVGVKAARERVCELYEQALIPLDYFGEAAASLRSLAASMTQ